MTNLFLLLAFQYLTISLPQDTSSKVQLGEIAYSNIRFGENYSSVSQKLDFFEEIGKYRYSTRGYYISNDGYTEYNLYRLGFRSYMYKTANYYDTFIRDHWQNLVEVISEKYGKKEGKYPSFLQIQSGYIVWTHTWLKGKKEIKIGVGCDDAEYYAVLWITDLDRKKIVDAQQKKDEEKAKKESSKKF